jgi:hypothetical protein
LGHFGFCRFLFLVLTASRLFFSASIRLTTPAGASTAGGSRPLHVAFAENQPNPTRDGWDRGYRQGTARSFPQSPDLTNIFDGHATLKHPLEGHASRKGSRSRLPLIGSEVYSLPDIRDPLTSLEVLAGLFAGIKSGSVSHARSTARTECVNPFNGL